MKKSLSRQFLLGAFVIVSLTLLAATFLEVNRDRSSLLERLDASARLDAALLLRAVEQPMLRGDAAAAAAELGGIAENFPALHFSVAAADGTITYSTRPEEVRARLEDAYPGTLGQSYLDALDGKFSGPGGAAAGQSGGLVKQGVFTRLIKKDGRDRVLLLAPIENRPECYSCHGWTAPVLGAAALLADVENELSVFARRSLALGGYALLLALALTAALHFFVRRRFFSRLERMSSLLTRIAGWEETAANQNGAPVDGSLSAPAGATDAAGAAAPASPAPPVSPVSPVLTAPAVPDDAKVVAGPAAADALDYALLNLEKISRVMEHLDFLESVLAAVPLAVAACDAQGRVAFVSRAFTELLPSSGAERAALLGRPLAELVHGRPHARSVFADLLRGRVPHRVWEESPPAAGGRRLRLETALIYADSSLPGAPLARLRPEVIGKPELAGILCFFHDIEQERRGAEALAARTRELRELCRASGLALAGLGGAAAELAGNLDEVCAVAAEQREGSLLQTQAAHRLAAALSTLAENWRDFMERARAGREAARAGREEWLDLGLAAQRLGQAALRSRDEAAALEERARALAGEAQAAGNVADQINLLALDAALEAAAAGIGPAAGKKKDEAEHPAGTLVLFSGEPRRGRPRKGEGPAANRAAALVLSDLVDRLRLLAEVSARGAEDLKTGLAGVNESAKSSREAAEAALPQLDGLARLLLSGDEKAAARLAEFDALLARGGGLEADLRERLDDGETLNRETARSGTLILRGLRATQAAAEALAAARLALGQLEDIFADVPEPPGKAEPPVPPGKPDPTEREN